MLLHPRIMHDKHHSRHNVASPHLFKQATLRLRRALRRLCRHPQRLTQQRAHHDCGPVARPVLALQQRHEVERKLALRVKGAARDLAREALQLVFGAGELPKLVQQRNRCCRGVDRGRGGCGDGGGYDAGCGGHG